MSNPLFESLDKAADTLRSVTASNLTSDVLHNAVSTLDGIPVNDLIGDFSGALPAASDDPAKEDERKKALDTVADDLNHKLDAVNDELKRIKSMRSTLNLEALDPVIHAAQKLVRPLFNLSADIRK